ncbi:MAG: hypothetical protein LBB67_00220 [Oscillospiraceae bacterium]|jgi:hypothetical protein|nr:hypothetical protein [Oscillospiraceae bacterium]
MDFEKPIESNLTPCMPTAEDLAKIHTYTRKKLAADTLYVFSCVLCDNEIDRDGERFPTRSLEVLAKLFVGKTGIFDHSMKANDQVMRLYDTELITESVKQNSLGEPYAQLIGKAYMLRNAANQPLIDAIDAGIQKEVSVSCAVKTARCSVCGKPFGRGGCKHAKGQIENGKRCFVELEEPTDAYEFSFVAVPAQPAAGVIKRKKGKIADAKPNQNERSACTVVEIKKKLAAGESLRLEADEVQTLQRHLNILEELAEDGRDYRTNLLAKSMRFGALAMPEMGTDALRSMCESLQTRQLEEVAKIFEQRACKAIPLHPQLSRLGTQTTQANTEFKC